MLTWYRFKEDLDKASTSEGVYFLSETASEGGIVYIGKADGINGIRQRLSQHPDPNNPCLQEKAIRYFAYEVTNNSEVRERELLRDYNPECNQDQ